MASRSEFTVEAAYRYNRSETIRWIVSHVWRYKLLFIIVVACYPIAWASFSYARILIGGVAEEIINPTVPGALLSLSIVALIVLLLDSAASLVSSLTLVNIAQRVERDTRQELYESLLGKSQTFHDRQRVGDIMARATDDVQQLNTLIMPGMLFIFDMLMGLVMPMIFIATIRLELLLIPALFIVSFVIAVRPYSARLNPVVGAQRGAFGAMNAGLEESVSGIEVVKASVQEPFERSKFTKNARAFRDYFAQQGRIEATYLPMLFYAFALGLSFLHSIILYNQGVLTIADVIAYTGLVVLLRFPVFFSLFAFTLVQLGIAGGDRILKVINEEADLDENTAGYAGQMRGEIVFENVSFGYEDGTVLENITFRVNPGETIAIVGQTGSGKSTLTELINRTYDATAGRVLIDGIDVREWSLESLRSQISRIEQDVFLFSRTLAENIAFGAPGTPQDKIEFAAGEAQAHNFIMSFDKGYQTEVGERGVTLSGGQRQRIALARAFLTNPRILILDDSTSAIDSATEDEIQKAINRAQVGRTTLLITHRLSQIRWADHILLLEDGRVLAAGDHESLLRTSEPYRRIFARYDMALPPLQAEPA
ncbi:MAG: ABC transporter ATP-binding protein [Chloroflexota bacterium]|nr:ABC transporter ATP-binding protein [Chloroflexota bacterium]